MTSIPKINSRFFCIINRKEKTLAAVISSYLSASGLYLPVFEFHEVSIKKPEGEEIGFDEYFIMTSRAEEFDVRTFNAIQRQGGCEYLILAGLTSEQKSFLGYLEEYNVIEISNLEDVQTFLGPLSEKNKYFTCPEHEIVEGLYIALTQQAMLKIDNKAAKPDVKIQYATEGIILVEDNEQLSPIIAVNFAFSVQAEIRVVPPPKTNIFEIKELISQWKSENSKKAFTELTALLFSSIDGIEFSKYKFATFFTFGAPYGLILKDIIPFSYVNTKLHPDFFIFNNVYIYNKPQIHSAIVFSPLEFGSDEETDFVIKKLESNQIFVKRLVGQTATVYNLDYHVKEYPYEILHLCSHGGEVPGYPVSLDFHDKNGNKHTIEYDDVVSFAPTKSEKLIEVTHKYIFRKMDGLTWKSQELDALNHPRHVYSTMMDSIHKSKTEYKVKQPSVEGSCSIKCSDFIYQGLFNSIAGHRRNPIIFNNTCWSWSGISDAFLSVGCTGYIGTMWAIDNKVAVEFAEKFYNQIFERTILEAFHDSGQVAHGTSSENIYLFWGLHFSFISKGDSIDKTRMSIASNLLESAKHWHAKRSTSSIKTTERQIHRLFNWNYNQLLEHFFKEAVKLFIPPNK